MKKLLILALLAVAPSVFGAGDTLISNGKLRTNLNANGFGLTSLSLLDGGAFELTIKSNGSTLIHLKSGNQLGFYGATPVVKPAGDVASALSTLGLVSSGSYNATKLFGIVEYVNLGTGGAGNGTMVLHDDGTWQTAGSGGGGGGNALTTDPLSQFAATTSAQLRTVLSDEVGTGAAYFVNGPLGTPASGTLTNATGLPITGIAGLGTNMATFLAATKPTTLAGYGIVDGQPLDADLTTWAGITPGTGVGTALAINVGTAGSLITNGGRRNTSFVDAHQCHWIASSRDWVRHYYASPSRHWESRHRHKVSV